MRKVILALIVVVVISCTWVALRKRPPHSYDQTLTSYFSSGSSLQPHAPVCVDGVVVGVVTNVRVRPELGERPIEVEMAISTWYELRIPDDSTVSLKTQGVLGQTFADIDTREAHGPAIGSNGVLKSIEVSPAESAEAIKRLGNALIKASASTTPSDKQPNSSGKGAVPASK